MSPRIRSHVKEAFSQPKKVLRIGIPLEYNILELHPTVRSAWLNSLHQISIKLGHTIHPISLPRTKQALSTYYVLAPSEASSNLAKYDGIRYGRRSPNVTDNAEDGYLYAKTRGEGFGPEVKRRILLGAYSLSAEAIDNYFIQAQKVRRLVQQDFDEVFSTPNPLHDTPDHPITPSSSNLSPNIDLILSPTAPTPPPLLSSLSSPSSSSPLNAYMNDVFTVPASLAGLPAISIPALPPSSSSFSSEAPSGNNDQNLKHTQQKIGMQIIGQWGTDNMVLRLAGDIEKMKEME